MTTERRLPACEALVNGRRGTTIGILDRGLQFGDGVFTTLAVHDGRPVWWERHLARLQYGCARLGIVPFPPADRLRGEVAELVGGYPDGVLKIIITRGDSLSGYAPGTAGPNRILVATAGQRHDPDLARDGIRAGICTTRLARNPQLAGIKHLNRLEQVLGRRECGQRWAEGIMLDHDDNLIEGTMSNLFLLQGDRLVTPDLEHCGVRGIAREWIMEFANALGVDCAVETVGLADLPRFDELFFCNSLIGLWPVRRLDDREYTISPLVRHLQKLLLESSR